MTSKVAIKYHDHDTLTSKSSLGSSQDYTLSIDGSQELRSVKRGRGLSIPDDNDAFDLPSSHRSRSRSGSTDELTINKLKYDEDIDLVGRNEQKKILHDCFERMMDDPSSSPSSGGHRSRRKELVLIRGHSGSGKSSLAATLKKPISAHAKGVYVQEKFDLYFIEYPFFAISKAFANVCSHVMTMSTGANEDLADSIGQALHDELGADVESLSRLVPEIDELIPEQDASVSSRGTTEQYDFAAGQERFKFAFRVLTRVLCKFLSPLVFVIDDLQWADAASLELIAALLSDVQNNKPSLMIIGCYRSDEVEKNSHLADMIAAITKKQEPCKINVTELDLQPIDVDDVNKIILALLGMDDAERTRDLAEVCFHRTLGNPNFVIEFVAMLEMEGLLSFNLGLTKWMWEAKKIENETMSTANVVELLIARLQKLPDETQVLIQYAACLGSTFDLKTLEILWKDHGARTCGCKDHLKLLQDGNFIESVGSDSFRWIHDSLQEAALVLGKQDKESLQFSIGVTLYNALSAKDGGLEDHLFAVTNLINHGVNQEKVEFAMLNLRAAKKARSLSAFKSGSSYAAKGIQCLSDDCWTNHRPLVLALYSIGAEMELASGNLEAVDEYSNEIINRDYFDILDKMPLYKCRMYKLATMDLRHQDAVDCGLRILEELGCQLVKSRTFVGVQAVISAKRTITKARNTSMEAYLSKSMDDTKLKEVMLVLYRMTVSCYFSGNPMIMILCITRSVQLTLDHGSSMMSGAALVNLAYLALGISKDFKAAGYLAEVAMILAKKGRSQYVEALTISNVHATTIAWTTPLQSLLNPMANAYTLGMKSGNSETAMWSLFFHQFEIPYVMGKPLGPMLEAFPNALSQCEEKKQKDQAYIMRMFWQMMLNLADDNSQGKEVLEGEIYSREEFPPQSPLHETHFVLVQMNLYIFFGNFEEAAKLALKVGGSFEATNPGIFPNMMETFHRGVALFAMARKTGGKGKYRSPAIRIRKQVDAWLKADNPNVLYFHHYLCAEQAALDRRYDEAERLYVEAIKIAARSGALHHAGLFNERFASFLREEKKMPEEAEYRTKEAEKYYQNWGAMGKLGVSGIEKLFSGSPQ
ncbi:unnamed protein product [Cylindrotheca closterium]|uniref:Orc1-like AAA ATPase domain-containing protein n=1 Tax=Cylindrotheca closterium TaxID=2856 RepID=A0AAD2G830_9STRA|nr:unnamed protein product [Cylindrotheca closterium]